MTIEEIELVKSEAARKVYDKGLMKIYDTLHKFNSKTDDIDEMLNEVYFKLGEIMTTATRIRSMPYEDVKNLFEVKKEG